MTRGDVILVRLPHPSGVRGKKRPVVVVQADSYSGVVSTVVVAEVTSNTSPANDPACLFTDLNTPDGKATGLLHDSVVSGLFLATVSANSATQTMGVMSANLMAKFDDCLKAALALT